MQRQDDIQGVAQNKVAEHVYALLSSYFANIEYSMQVHVGEPHALH